MKSIPSANSKLTPDFAAPPPKEPQTHATVYTFVVWDHDANATAIYPKMATQDAIARMRGKVNEDTAWVVDSSALDIEGFYMGSIRDD